mmetsp:Transcript_43910/g.93420  ORF Transcript_43910/g.93420 Transcript_43910/m.93420 type:complete len:203 (+) Transcript_43910:315-923(+)
MARCFKSLPPGAWRRCCCRRPPPPLTSFSPSSPPPSSSSYSSSYSESISLASAMMLPVCCRYSTRSIGGWPPLWPLPPRLLLASLLSPVRDSCPFSFSDVTPAPLPSRLSAVVSPLSMVFLLGEVDSELFREDVSLLAPHLLGSCSEASLAAKQPDMFLLDLVVFEGGLPCPFTGAASEDAIAVPCFEEATTFGSCCSCCCC